MLTEGSTVLLMRTGALPDDSAEMDDYSGTDALCTDLADKLLVEIDRRGRRLVAVEYVRRFSRCGSRCLS